MMSGSLYSGNVGFRNYRIYRRARLLTGLSFAVFGIGFLLHAHFEWRYIWPAGATALTVSYFHIGGVLISWSHTSLLNPYYLNSKLVLRDVSIVILALIGYWTAAVFASLEAVHWCLLIFLFHIGYLTYIFYRTYFRVKRLFCLVSQDNIEAFVCWMLRSCHLIIGFGLGSVVFTSFFPSDIWPYIVLLCVGTCVFIYIFYSISEYGFVIDKATNATEDIAQKKYRKVA